MPSLKTIVFVLIASILPGLVGALPAGMLALVVGNIESARDIYILGSILLSSWFPLKLLIDLQVKGQVNFKFPEFSINQLSIFIVLFAAIPLILLLYVNTFLPFLIAALVYRFTEGSILASLIPGIGLLAISIYRSAQREKEMGTHNSFFVRMQDVSQSNFVVEINPDTVRRQTPREVEPQVIYLPEENLRDRSEDTSEQPPMTITIDPDTVSEQSDDEA